MDNQTSRLLRKVFKCKTENRDSEGKDQKREKPILPFSFFDTDLPEF
jgi:hypothetical protein